MTELGTCKGCSAPVRKPLKFCGGDHCLKTGQGASPRPSSGAWSGWRNRQEQTEFRKRLLALYGGRCAAVGGLSTFVDLEQGSRCPVTDPALLVAHHGKDGEPDLLLCERHHAEVDQHARRRH